MARVHAIETRIEKLSPSIDEYFTCGFLNRDELREVVRQRRHWEYRLVAKPLLLIDVQDAVRYELDLEQRLQVYCESTKVELKHRWIIMERIEYIYRVGLKHIKKKSEWEFIRKEFVTFLKRHHRHGSLSKLYGELMIKYLTRSDLWVEAALWEAVGLNNVHNARSIIQQALLTMTTDPTVWTAGLKVELHFVNHSLKRFIEEYTGEKLMKKARKEPSHSPLKGSADVGEEMNPDKKAEPRISAQMRAEDEHLSEIVLDLELCKVIVGEALQGPAFSPILVTQLLTAAGEFPFTRELILVILKDGQHRMLEVLASDRTTQRVRTEWQEGGLSAVLRPFILTEHLLVNGYLGALVDCATFVDHEGAVPKPSSEARRTATMRSLATVLILAVQRPRGIMNMTGNFTAVGQLLCTSAHELLATVKGHCSRGVSRICLTLLKTQTISVEEVVRLLLNVKRLSEREKVTYVAHAHDRVQDLEQLVRDTLGFTAASPSSSRTPSMGEPKTNSIDLHWPTDLLSDLIAPEDRAALWQSRDRAKGSPAASETLDAGALDRFLLWLRLEERERPRGSKAVSTIPASQRKAIENFLSQYRLLPASSFSDSLKKNDPDDRILYLLSRKHTLSFRDSQTTPLRLWRLFSALETLHPRKPSLNESTKDDDDDDDDDDDNDDDNKGHNNSLSFKSFVEAGLNFIAGMTYASLSRAEQWERATGICTLVRSRFYTFTGLKRFTREDILSWMRKTEKASLQADVKMLFCEMCDLLRPPNSQLDRCQPLPRFCFVHTLLPFLEALVLFYERNMENKKEKEDALYHARTTHERVINIYQLSNHPEDFIPLLYDSVTKDVKDVKASHQVVESLNTNDWFSFVTFEREVAKDLNTARVVAERARRWALAPQQLLVKLSGA
ncbi:unnamed protein product [Phytomonas sp. Hart1]|nr:unnamed protein product [Phytomonas sp. Hart1]|eukprot:CCW69405.1 unnamed protein product [Phytomonas sp. isolate Hart1]